MSKTFGYSIERIGWQYSFEFEKHFPVDMLTFDSGKYILRDGNYCSKSHYIEIWGSPSYFDSMPLLQPRICMIISKMQISKETQIYSMLNWDNDFHAYRYIPSIHLPENVVFSRNLITFINENNGYLVHYFEDNKTKELWTVVKNEFTKVTKSNNLRSVTACINVDMSDADIPMSNPWLRRKPEYQWVPIEPDELFRSYKYELIIFKYLDSKGNSHVIQSIRNN